MELHKRKKMLTVFTTPKELRMLADEMEEKYPKMLPGDSSVISSMVETLKGKFTFKIAVDQSLME